MPNLSVLSAAPMAADRAAKPALSRSVEWLIDNAEAYDALIRSIRGARASVWMTQLALDADCTAYGAGAVTGDQLLLGALLEAAESVDVRVLLNATLLLDTTKPLLRALRSRADLGRGMQLRGVRRFPQLLHAKMVIVDGVRAFLLGSPFVNGYWDTASHHPVDARRPARELGGRPLHDVSVVVNGPAVGVCVDIFEELWEIDRDTGRRGLPSSAREPTANLDDGIDIVTTSPALVLHSQPNGSTGTLDALLDGIRSARRLIYVEHQYLSARLVVCALADALEREPALEIIIVLNENPDITAYRRWQTLRLAEAGLLDHPRVGLFGLWSTRATDAGMEINQIFVHSKVVIVDDAWAMVGSANLDGVSLHSYGDDFTGFLGRRIFRGVRNFDIGIVVREGVPASGIIADLRERLWGEHLGVSRERVPTGDAGALRHWRAAAAWNVLALNGIGEPATPQPMKGFVLPFSLLPTPAEQLADIGVRATQTRLHLCFNPGWLEVNFSPNWVRNMFL